MAQQQGRHHIFGDGVFMPEAAAQHRSRGQARAVDRVGAGGRRMPEPEPARYRLGGAEPDADDDVRAQEVLLLAGPIERVADLDDLVRLRQQRVEAVTEVEGVAAVKHDLHGASLFRRAGRQG